MSDIGGRSGIADPADPRAFDAGHAHPDTIVPRLGGRRRWWRDARRRRMLAIADLAATGIAAGVVGITLGSGWPLIFLPFWLLIAKFFGLYDRDHRALRHLTADEVPLAGRLVRYLLRSPRTAAAADAGGLAGHGRRDRELRDHRGRGDRRPLVGAPAVVDLDAARARRHGRRRKRPADDAPQDRPLPRHALRARGRAPDRWHRRRRAAHARAARGRQPRRPDHRQRRRRGHRHDRGAQHDLPQAPGQAQRRLAASWARDAVAADQPARRPSDPRVQHLGRVPLLDPDQADLRHRHLGRRPAPALAGDPACGDRDQARLARACLLLPGPRRLRWSPVPDVQVPDDAGRCRGDARRSRQPRRARRPDVQDPRRPPHHPRSGGSCAAPRSTRSRSSSMSCWAR